MGLAKGRPQSIGVVWDQDEVNVVRHEAVGPDLDPGRTAARGEKVAIDGVVRVVEDGLLSPIATLRPCGWRWRPTTLGCSLVRRITPGALTLSFWFCSCRPMASERTGRMYCPASFPNLPLAHGVKDDRHVRAICRCGASAVVDTAPWIAEGLGGQPLHSFQDRMRCIPCGARSAKLEIWYRKARPSLQGAIYVFR